MTNFCWAFSQTRIILAFSWLSRYLLFLLSVRDRDHKPADYILRCPYSHFRGSVCHILSRGTFVGNASGGICLFVLLRPFERKRRRSIAPVALALTALAAVFAVSNVAERSMDRFSNVGEDSRLAYWEQSWPLVVEYFPVGAGLATFSTLFRVNEKLEWVDPTYLNHAHNDYIEILIEVGAIGAALVGLGDFGPGAFNAYRLAQARYRGGALCADWWRNSTAMCASFKRRLPPSPSSHCCNLYPWLRHRHENAIASSWRNGVCAFPPSSSPLKRFAFAGPEPRVKTIRRDKSNAYWSL